MTPGPIALNAATFVGIQVAGLPGALIATIGCIFPSCVIVMTLAYLYYRFRGLSIVQGVFGRAAPRCNRYDCLCRYLVDWSGTIRPTYSSSRFEQLSDLMALVIFLAGFFVLRKWKPSPIKVMAGAAVAGVVLYSITA